MTDAEAPAPRVSSGASARLERKLLSGIAWTGTATAVTQLLSWLSFLVVARLLRDTDYGIMGMAGVYISFLYLIGEFGLGAALVVRRDLGRDLVARIGGLAILAGVAFASLSAAVAWPVGFFFQEPRVVPVIMVLGTTFVITGLRCVPYSLLSRDMRFKAVAMVDTVDALTQTIATLSLALSGAGYWALTGGIILGRVAGTVAAICAYPHPVRWPKPFEPIASAVRFGAQVVLSRIVWFLYSSADTVVLGRRLGSAALGDYALASGIAQVPISKIYALYQKATSSVFASAKDDLAALRPHVLVLLRAISLVSFPLSIGLALMAGPFVRVVLGYQWEAAVTSLRLLAGAAAFRSLDPMLAQLLIFVGKASLTTRVSTGAALILPVCFLIGTKWGLLGVGMVWLIVYPVVVLLHLLVLVRRVTGITFADVGSALWPATSAVGLMSIAVAGFLGLTRGQGDPIRLLAGVAIGAVAYVVVLLLFHRPAVMELVAIVRRRNAAPSA